MQNQPQTPIRIRPISREPADADRWLGMRRLLWPDCSAERHRLEMEMLQREGDLIIVAEEADGNTPVGFAEVSIRTDHVSGTSSSPVPYLEGWYVAPRYRGTGVGRELLSYIEGWSRRNGYREIASDAEIDNDSAIEAHLHLGFKEIDRTVSFVKPLKG